MTTADQDPGQQHAAGQLFVRVQHLAHVHNAKGHGLTPGFVRDLKVLIREHRRATRARGIDFPEMVPIILTRCCGVELVRRDLERDALQTVILNLTVKYPTVQADEIAQALHWAFPNYAPTSLDMRPLSPRNRPRPGVQ